MLRLWLALRDLGEDRLAEIGRLVQTFLNDRGSMQPVTFTELQKRNASVVHICCASALKAKLGCDDSTDNDAAKASTAPA